MLIFDEAKGTSRLSWLKSTVAPGANDATGGFISQLKIDRPLASFSVTNILGTNSFSAVGFTIEPLAMK